MFSVFSVSSLFLVLVWSNKLYCISITYEELTGFQEEDYDARKNPPYYARISTKEFSAVCWIVRVRVRAVVGEGVGVWV